MLYNSLPKITDEKNLEGKKVFVRGNIDVPIQDGHVVDQFRLTKIIPTLQYLVDQGAKVILAGHVGRDPKNTALPIFEVFKQQFDIIFSKDVGGPDSQNVIEAMGNGQIVMLENLRRDPREIKNDPEFSRQLAGLAELYVNAAFANSHREHSSMIGVASLLPSYISMDFAHEVEELEKAMTPESPSLFMLGGAKFETKMPLVEKFLDLYDQVFVGGALANNFFKAKGWEIGTSLVSEVDLTDSPLLHNSKLLLPVDVTVTGDNGVRVVEPTEVEPGERMVDCGPATSAMLNTYITKAKMVLWNGPFGDYEHGFGIETQSTAKHIAAAEGYSVIGGGDTVAAIEELHNQNQFSFLSTAGGAMLAFLEQGTLPVIEIIANQSK